MDSKILRTFRISDDPDLQKFFRMTACVMAIMFKLPIMEAVGRVNSYWGSRDFSNDQKDLLFHEHADSWACRIYYVRGVRWWEDGAELRVRLWP